jgi:hypothetical protein
MDPKSSQLLKCKQTRDHVQWGHHVFWIRPDSQCTTVTTGSDHGHGFRNAPTEMPVGLAETVQVGRRMVAFAKEQGRSEAFVGGLPENK